MKRTSIYMSDKVKALKRPDESFSSRLGAVSDRYLSIIRRSSPDNFFSDEELKLIVDSINNNKLDPVRVIQFYVDDNLLLIEHKDRELIVDKIKNLSLVQCIALVEYVELTLKENL